jgi:hypothetical protein
MAEGSGRPIGRPSSFEAALGDAICERIADGQSLRAICLDENMPNKATVFRWLADDRYLEFRDQYERAREAQADALFDDILDIADDGSNDWMERKNAEGQNVGWSENGEALRRSVLRVDARKWMAGKLRPKKYGDKIFQEHSGAVKTGLDVEALRNLTDEQREQLRALSTALSSESK